MHAHRTAADAGPIADVPAQTLEAQMLLRSPVGIAVVDPEGLIRSVNPAYCALYGYPADALVGQMFTMIIPPPQREHLLSLHRQFVAGSGEMKGEFDVLRSDGSRLGVMLESVRVPGADGRTWRMACVVDITPHRVLEQVLQDSQQFLSSVLDALTAHVCVLDASGMIIAVNHAWREFARAQGEHSGAVFEGVNYLDVCERAARSALPDADQARAFRGLLADVLAGRRQQFQFEYPCHAPGEQRWFLARVSRILGSQPARFVVAHDNVSAIKLAQETVRESEAQLRDLAASIPGALFRVERQPDGNGWRCLYISPGVHALFEVSPEQVYADHGRLSHQVLPEDLAALRASVADAERRQARWAHEFRVCTPGGVQKWILAEAAPKRDADGRVVWTGVYTDVSERKRVEAVLRASEETFRTLFETVPQGVVYHDIQGRITSANPAAERILGLTLEPLRDRNVFDARWDALREDGSPVPADEFPPMVALRTGQPVKDVVMSVAVPGHERAWIQVSATPLFKQGRLCEVYTSFEDITPRMRLSQELRLQATTDYLTGAANRRSLMERLQVEHQRVQRHPGIRCSVLALDLDLFKHVNDVWGHAAGDAALVHLTRLMRQETRTLDLVSRSGGEEFMLLLPDTGLDDATALAERLRERVAGTPALFGALPIAITVSIGVSMMLPGDASVDAVLGRADRALYEAKHAGRNAVRRA